MEHGSPDIITFETKEKLARELASTVLGMIKKASLSGEEFNIALSGGSTPKILFRQLANLPDSKDRSTWEKAFFYWVDERCVPPDHPESNYRMTNDTLLQDLPIPSGNVFRMRGEDDPNKEVIRYSKLLYSQLPLQKELPVFDLILLGMGTDGHTASIFPDQMNLLESEELCAVGYHPETEQARITLTGNVINQAKNIFFLVTGNDKAEVLEGILGNVSPNLVYPASHIDPPNGTLKWYLDAPAASKL